MKEKIKDFFNINLRSFYSRLMLSYLIIILISLTVIGISFGYLVQRYYFGLKEWDTTNNGRRIAKLVSENISGGILETRNIQQAGEKLDTIARSSNMDIGLMDERGALLFNSSDKRDFTLPLEEEEINNVLQGNSLTKKIMGPEFKNLLMVFPLMKSKNNPNTFIITPQPPGDPDVVGGIIIQTALGGVTDTINNITKLIIYSFVIAIIAAVFVSIPFSRKVTRPLADVKKSAINITEGNFRKVSMPENSSEEIKHLVKTFNYAVNQIEETLERKRHLDKIRKEFVANISHEFRAPLTSIKGFLELLLEEDNEINYDEINEYADIMYKDTVYLENLLSDLIILSQLDSRNVSLEKENINPGNLVNRTIKSMENKLEEKNLAVTINVPEKLPEINVDPNRIYQVLINLLDNAITYSPEGGKIIITVETINDRIKFSLTDQGPGISEEDQNKVWQRFYKADTARTREKRKGSGLGLSIVKDIITKHNGEVYLKSTPGQGSTFSFIIPVRDKNNGDGEEIEEG